MPGKWLCTVSAWQRQLQRQMQKQKQLQKQQLLQARMRVCVQHQAML
jgi:hypothetical protein